jgi:N-acetylglucosamine-6-sulfatase
MRLHAGAGRRLALPLLFAVAASFAGLDPSPVLSPAPARALETRGGPAIQARRGERAAASRPNIIVIQTDDQDAGSITRRVMPNVHRLLARPGTTFTDYIDSGPLCCPSRAVLLTGQYGHNNGVTWDNPNPYRDLRGKNSTLPVWLRRAGYRTAHLGKFLNLYAKAVDDPNEVPPGWDEWHTILEPVRYYDYTLRENGRAVEYGSRHRDYLTHVLDEKAVHLIHRFVPWRRPLFMELDEFAPHGSSGFDTRCRGAAIPAYRDRDLFENAPLPMPPSFNEADVSDKPSFIRAQPPLGSAQIADLKRKYGCRLASLRAVDRGVGRISEALREERALGNTAIIFTSDNGWLLGQHRVPGSKVDPYEESLHVPLIARLPWRMRGPGGAPQELRSTVANVDVAPTILRLAGAKPCPRSGPCRILDGRSLLKAIRSDGRRWPRSRGIPLELRTPQLRAGPFTPCDYQGVRTRHEVLVNHHSATQAERGACNPLEEFEHYDLRSDPFELDNLYPAATGSAEAARERLLLERLARLRDCAGLKGRDPTPASGHYCE